MTTKGVGGEVDIGVAPQVIGIATWLSSQAAPFSSNVSWKDCFGVCFFHYAPKAHSRYSVGTNQDLHANYKIDVCHAYN